MRARHGDDQDAGLERKIPRRVEIDSQRVTALAAPRALLARARDGVHRARLEIDDANLMILGVGDIQQIAACPGAVEGSSARPCGR